MKFINELQKHCRQQITEAISKLLIYSDKIDDYLDKNQTEESDISESILKYLQCAYTVLNSHVDLLIKMKIMIKNSNAFTAYCFESVDYWSDSLDKLYIQIDRLLGVK